MKIVLFVFLVLLLACEKHNLSQEDQEHSEPLQSNQIIENEHGGLRFFITNGKAELQSSVPVFTTVKFANYYIQTDRLPRNSSTELYFSGTGIFDLEVEGFTAMPNSKRFKVIGLPGGAKFRMAKGVVKYSFVKI